MFRGAQKRSLKYFVVKEHEGFFCVWRERVVRGGERSNSGSSSVVVGLFGHFRFLGSGGEPGDVVVGQFFGGSDFRILGEEDGGLERRPHGRPNLAAGLAQLSNASGQSENV